MKRLKRIIGVLLVALLIISPLTFVDAATTKKTTTTTTTTTTKAKNNKNDKKEKQPIKVYVFYGSTCPHCQEFHEFLAKLQQDKKYNYMFEVVDYEVWSSETNSQLMTEVGEYFDYTVTGVPFYVIGENYYSGYGESSNDSIKKAIKEAYNDENYKDVVASIGTGEIVDDDEATEEEEEKKAGNDVVGIIILVVAVIIVILLIIGSSKNKYDEEDEEVEVKEEPKETKASTEKKSTTKKTTTKSKKSK